MMLFSASYSVSVDAYIAQTKVLIEQKGVKIDLHRAYEQSDGAVLSLLVTAVIVGIYCRKEVVYFILGKDCP